MINRCKAIRGNFNFADNTAKNSNMPLGRKEAIK